MADLDVICIGAVNYDYMFHCTKEDIVLDEEDSGNEDLGGSIANVEKDITELLDKERPFTTQIGGSAFITLKVIKHILPRLHAAYVGSCGMPNNFDLLHGKSNDIEKELAHLDDREWFFTPQEHSDDYSRTIAKSIVRLYNHTRNCIKIAPCANNALLSRITAHEESSGHSFSEYLAKARWIHLSSLSDFDQFEAIMQHVIQAKALNPSLKVSMDPGFEYTSLRRDRLQPLIAHADYVFLNKSECSNLGLGAADRDTLFANLDAYFTAVCPSSERTLIIKHIDHHELVRFESGQPIFLRVPHTVLALEELNNDTGAGDSFAGGFISGMLCESLNGDIARAINLGVIAAKGRMRSHDHEDPYLMIQNATSAFISEYK